MLKHTYKQVLKKRAARNSGGGHNCPPLMSHCAPMLQNYRPSLMFCGARAMSYTTLFKNENQALGLAQYAIKFMAQDHDNIHEAVYDRVRLFHTDSTICGISAIAQKTNAPTILRREAIDQYRVDPNLKGKANQ